MMLSRLPGYNFIASKTQNMGSGNRDFFKNLVMVGLAFGFSKVFSSIATVIFARVFGPTNFGEARNLMLVAQLLTFPMLMGLSVSLMKFGTGKDNPAPQIATSFWLVSASILTISGFCLYFQDNITQYISRWLSINTYKFHWAIGMAVLMSTYALFASAFQALNLYKLRGIIEGLLAFMLLPGLAIGYWFWQDTYVTQLIAYSLAYLVTIPAMVWRFRHMLSYRHLFAPDTKAMLNYGLYACLGNVGFVLTYLLQPLQVEWALDLHQVGIYSLYTQSSITLAAFATGIFYTVFFPKLSISQNRDAIWHRLTRVWLKFAIPVFGIFLIIQALTILAGGNKYPFLWDQVALFSLAATLITIQSTYGQIITSQGIRGVRWGLVLSLFPGILNFLISYWLIPKWGLVGAITAIIINYSVSLAATLLCGRWLMRSGGLADA